MKKTKGIDYKWIVLILTSATYFLAQGTRQIYAAVLPQIKTDFASLGISDTSLGLISSVFTWVFGLVMPFAGIFADLYKRKWIIVAGCLLFSVGIFCSGFASQLAILFICYGLVNAMGQALLPPCNSSLISQYHTTTRGTAYSIYQAAVYLGIILCSVCSGYLASLGAGGWRKAFWIFGVIGVMLCVVIVFFLKDTPQPQSSTAQERPTMKEAVKAFVSKPTALILMAALGCYFFATYGFKTWVPLFMMRVFPDMPMTTAVFHAVFWFYLGAFAGVTLAGRTSDKYRPRRSTIRVEVEIIGIILCIPFILMMAFAHTLPVMIIATALFGFATGIYDSNLYATLMDVIDPRYRASATGILGGGGSVIGAFGPAVMGWMNEMFSMRISFAALSIFALLGALLLSGARIFTFHKDKV